MWFLFSRMDFPSSLRPTLFMAGPLGLSNVPDLSFMCSWRDALMLPESLPENSEVKIRGRALAEAPLSRAQAAASSSVFLSCLCSADALY